MRKLTLDVEALAVESCATTPATAPDTPHDRAQAPVLTRVTSCPGWPYCTC